MKLPPVPKPPSVPTYPKSSVNLPASKSVTVPMGHGPAVPGVRDRFGTEVRQENRRTMDIVPSVTHPFAESPARMLPRSHSLQGMARAKKIKAGGGALL